MISFMHMASAASQGPATLQNQKILRGLVPAGDKEQGLSVARVEMREVKQNGKND